MKSIAIAILSVLVMGSASVAQQPQIITFMPNGTLTWTNGQVDDYCGIEWSWNLNYTWSPLDTQPPFWDLWTTQTVTSVVVTNVDSFHEQVVVLAQALGDTAHGLFLRVVSSSGQLGPRFATNNFRLANAGISMLSNVTFGLKQNGSYVSLMNWPQVFSAATTDAVSVWEQWPPPSQSRTMFDLVPMQDGWYVSYDQAGSNHLAEGWVISFGPPEKNVWLTVSNNSITLSAEWSRLTRTVGY